VQIFRVLTIGSSFTLVGSAFEGRKFKWISEEIWWSVYICKASASTCRCMHYEDLQMEIMQESWKNWRRFPGQIYTGLLNQSA
jgi:hypothetical protein